MLHQNSPVSIIASQFGISPSIEDNTTQSNADSVITCIDENLSVIWCHDDEDLSENIQTEMKNRLNKTFTSVIIFHDPCQFAAYLIGLPIETKIFFIITSKNAKFLCMIAERRPQCEQIYQFQSTTNLDNRFLEFTDSNELFKQISNDKEVYLNKHQSSSTAKLPSDNCRQSIYLPPWSISNFKITENSFQYWRKESPEFFLFQALTRILIQMKYDPDRSFQEMIEECRLHCMDPVKIPKIDKFANDYKSESAIRYYTENSFLFRLVGRAFRSEDFECIFKFRRYIIDLHREIDKLVKNRESTQKILRLYRGKKIRTTILQKLQNNIGSLISMNGFLSTTCNRDVALQFVCVETNRSNYENVLFEFHIDEIIISRIYADISVLSQFSEEEEVLFTIGSIWRIDSVEKNDDLFWTVKLITCSDADSKLIQFFKQLPDDSTFLMLGDVLRELGQHTKAEKFYNKMLSEPTVSNETRGTLYYNIAMINVAQGKDSVALDYLHKAEELVHARVINTEPLAPQLLCSHSIVPSPIHMFNNMGVSYQKIENSQKALEYFERALNIEKSDPIDKATVYDNIALLHYSKGDYPIALKNFTEAVKLAQDHSSLPKFKQHYDAVNKHLLSKNDSLDKKLNEST